MKREQLVILIADDDESDLLLITSAFRKNGVKDPIETVNSGEAAIAYLRGDGKYQDRKRFPYPSVLLTDLKMPGVDGFGVLRNIKEHPRWRVIPVLVLSSSDDPDDVKRSYSMGASCFLRKPASHAMLCRILQLFYDFWIECEIPEIDITGKQVPTQHRGKLGERFGPVD